MWNGAPDHIKIQSDLEKFGLVNRRVVLIDISDTEDLHNRVFETLGIQPAERDTEAIKTRQIIDKMCVLFNIDYRDATSIMTDSTYVMSRTGRIRNVINSNGVHIVSPRLAEGGLSLTIEGAKLLHSLRKYPIPTNFGTKKKSECDGNGLAWVVVDSDAEPFVKQGRNVMHGFVLACDEWTRPDETVLIVNQSGELLAIGRSQSTPEELSAFKKGIAIKVREGCP